ncbi:MAG: phosphatidate cytidylyltransferase [Pelagimonas sp.]
MTGNWRDLGTRAASALVLLSIAAGAALAGPIPFSLLIAVISGLMLWELAGMHSPRSSIGQIGFAVIGGALVVAPFFLRGTHGLADPLTPMAALAVLGTLGVSRDKVFFALYAFAILITGSLLSGLYFRAPELVGFLLVVVILTDVAGYFAGKSIGGAKFWPAISPKKTWAGIIAGWCAAALLAAILVAFGITGPLTILVAACMSFASQLGDIAESALKRRAGVKDSSNLIPGHGGFLDRFDGVVGASPVLLIALLTLLTF